MLRALVLIALVLISLVLIALVLIALAEVPADSDYLSLSRYLSFLVFT